MSTKQQIEELAEVLCYCDQTQELPEDGHPFGTPGCTSVVKPGNYSMNWCSRDHYGLAHCTKCHSAVRGTCPECGKYLRVVRIADKGAYPVIGLGMAPHKSGGQECTGTGQVPVETTYRSGRNADLLERAS